MTSPNWQPYLNAIARHYAQWWTLYTLTDTLHRDREKQRPLASPFDFGLMVEAVQKEVGDRDLGDGEELPEAPKEKIERLPVLEGVCKYAAEHVLLRGRPGSGKSTALARLMLEGAEGKIPVLVELRFWQHSVSDRILASLHKHDPALNLDEATLKTLLRQGCFLLLMDGVNELPSEAARRDVACFRQDFPHTPMIFTTRELSVGGDLGIDKKLEMQPLSEPQMQGFVKAYLPNQADQLLRQLKDRLREFGQTPLLLWMLCGLFQQTGTIPPNLGMVFRQFTQGYERNVKQDAPVSAESRRWWSPLLQRLAFVMMHENVQLTSTVEFRVAIARSEALAVFKQLLQQEGETASSSLADECLEDLIEHHLIQLNGDQIEFRHQLLQEYYAAEYLLPVLPTLSDAKLKRDYLNYLKWTEAIAMMLALVLEEDQALRVVDLALSDVDLMLGARLAGEVKPAFQSKTVDRVAALEIPELLKVELLERTRSDKAIPALLKALEHPDSDVRRRAAEALGTLGRVEAIPGLLKAIEHPSDDVRWSAAHSLGKIGSDEAIPALLKAIEHPSDDVRWSAAGALGRIGSDAAVIALLTFIEHSNGDVRESASNGLGKIGLGKIGSDAAIPALLKALEHPNGDVRESAVNALGRIGGNAVIPALLKALEHPNDSVYGSSVSALVQIGSDAAVAALLKFIEHPDNDVRERAVNALGRIATLPPILVSLKSMEHPNDYMCGSVAKARGETAVLLPTLALFKAIEHSNDDVRESAANVLRPIDSEAAILAVFEDIQHPNSRIRLGAANVLKQIGGTVSILILLKVMEHPDNDVRETAADALGQIASDAATLALLKAIEDPNENVRKSAAGALGRVGSDAATLALLKAIEDPNENVRKSAADGLGYISSDAVVLALLKAIGDPSDNVRERAAFALGNIGSNVAIPTLLKVIEHPNSTIRWSAAYALGEIGSDTATPALLKAIEDPDEDVRERAAYGLGQIGSKVGISGLLKAIEDPNENVRKSAADALGKSGSEVGISGLLKAIEDPNEDVRKSAADALGKSGSEVGISGLLKAIEDPNEDVRKSAADALGKSGSAVVLSHFWRSRLKNPTDWYLGTAIASIQARCKFYNYEIFRSPATEEKLEPLASQSTIIYDQRGATIGNVAHMVQGNQVTNPVAPDSTSPRETCDDSKP